MTLDMALVGSGAAVVTGIIAVGWLLDSGMDANPELKGRLGQSLRQSVAKEPEAWLQSANRTFLQAFDKLYGGNSTSLELAVWVGMVLALIALPILRNDVAASGTLKAETTLLLFIALLFAFFFTAMTLAFISLGVLRRFFARTHSTLKGTVSGIVGTILTGTVGGIVIALLVGTIVGITVGIVTIVGVNLVFIVVSGRLRIPIHPLKALGWSVVFVCIIGGLFQRDAGREFVSSAYADPKILTFVAFNVFADGISLLETRWVLQRGTTASLRALVGLVTLDLVASAVIYLFLPTVVWPEILEFGEVVLFRGERPWLGILFWTTFSTSFLFYLFVAGALLVRPLTAGFSLFGWLSTPFGLEAHPIRCLAVAMAVVVTMAFVAGGIVQTV